MAVLYYKDPDTGQFIPIIGQDYDLTLKADKSYVDTQDGLKVNKSGDTMTGPLVITGGRIEASGGEFFITNPDGSALLPLRVADPTYSVNAATKGYVDNSLSASSAWAEYMPTITQGVAVSLDWYPMRYVKIGRLVIVSGLFRCSSSGTSGQAVTFTVPVSARIIPGTRIIGNGFINSGLITAAVMLESNSQNVCKFRLANGGDYNTQITNGWVASISLMYEAAS